MGVMVAVGAFAQSWSDITSHPETYYFGEGWAETADEADREALANLLSQIKMNISVSQTQRDTYQNEGGNIVADNTLFQSTFSSFGQATLENTMRLDMEQTPKRHVGRYIRRSDVEKIWASRRNKIHEMINSAQEATEKGKVDVALRNYYWALSLLRSMQRSGDEKYEGHTLLPWLREQIDELLGDLRVAPRKVNGSDVEVQFTFRGKPVTSLDFRYNDGGFMSELCSVKDGLGLMELTPGLDPEDSYDLEIEVAYKSQTRHDPELRSVMEGDPDPILFSNANMKVRGIRGITASAPAPAPSVISSAATANSFTSINPEKFARPAETATSTHSDVMERIVAALRSGNTASVKELFEPEAFGNFTRLVRYGNAKLIGDPQLSYMPFGDQTQVRGTQLSFRFRNGVRRNFTEDVIFTLGADGLVSNVAFGLGRTAEDDVMGRSVYPEQARKVLADFISNYQTAFALKRLDYIEKIFDDNALIIVGKVLKQASDRTLNDAIRLQAGEQFQYNRLTKQEYIDNLRKCFASNEYINLRFNRVEVRRANNGGEIYGIQLEQDYYSTNYSDHGYLFLEVNLNNPAEPIILVRTWQPKPDPDFGLYDVNSFTIY